MVKRELNQIFLRKAEDRLTLIGEIEKLVKELQCVSEFCLRNLPIRVDSSRIQSFFDVRILRISVLCLFVV